MNSFQKSNKSLMYSYFLIHSKKIILAFFLALLLALTSCLLAYLVGPSLSFVLQSRQDVYVIEDLVGSQVSQIIAYFFSIKKLSSKELVGNLIFYLVFFSVLKAVSTVIQSLIWELIGEKIALSLRVKFFAFYVMSHPHSKITFEEEGFDKNIATLMTTDIKLFRDYIVSVWGGFSRELIQVFALSFGLFLLSPLLFFSFIFCLIPVSFILKKIGKKLKKRSWEALDGYALLSEWLQERFLGLETIKSRRTEKYEIERMMGFNKSLFDKYYRLAYTQSRTSPLLEMVAVCALIVVVFFALNLVQKGSLTASVVLSFFTLLAILSQSINKLGRYFNKNKASEASRDRIFKYLSLCKKEKEVSFKEPLLLSEGDRASKILFCHNVSFFYKRRSSLGLKNFNKIFLKKKFYCLTGPSGCGKSTLLKCILGLLPYPKGDIKYHPNLLPLKNIAYVSQKISLPPIRVAECVSYPQKKINKARLEEALHKVDLLEFFQTLKDGFDTILNDEIDTGFSGGQNQRLLFARVFYHKYPLIIIDEGTSSLDHKIEEKICFNLRKQIEETSSTVIFVSHSKKVMGYSDEVIHMA